MMKTKTVGVRQQKKKWVSECSVHKPDTCTTQSMLWKHKCFSQRKPTTASSKVLQFPLHTGLGEEAGVHRKCTLAFYAPAQGYSWNHRYLTPLHVTLTSWSMLVLLWWTEHHDGPQYPEKCPVSEPFHDLNLENLRLQNYITFWSFHIMSKNHVFVYFCYLNVDCIVICDFLY